MGGSGLLPTPLARQEPGNAASAQAEFILILMEKLPNSAEELDYGDLSAAAARACQEHHSKSPILIPLPISTDSRAGEEGAIRSVDHAVVGGVVAVVVFAMLCLLIILGRYFARHKGTYFTHEAKGADDAADADTAIINAEGGQNNSEEKKEYFI
ncbi:hypothetical protein DV515_00013381 [Chloebia gouldiae]|uniref:Neurexin/syndecan/glycophorin C domain-containing protein n=1 Tax=Chloebia gouldiae TaxID=44316 RepID=A0A3L8S144_CHLGU|nr:hypothetical protein DV515_00013381 [Chloebia gouldiae]